MKKRLSFFFLTVVVLMLTNSFITACDEQQTNTYVMQVLFGNDAQKYKFGEKTQILLKALYLCSEQSDGEGQKKLMI